MGAEPSPAGTERLRPRLNPGDGVGQGSGPGLGWRAGGQTGRDSSRGMPWPDPRHAPVRSPTPRIPEAEAAPRLPTSANLERGHGGRAGGMSGTHVPGRGPDAGARRAAGGGAGGSWCPRGPRAGGARIALARWRGGRRQPEPHGAGPGAAGGGRARGAAPPRPPPEP